jgi:cysteinyl-tRNA synthetase
LRQFEDAIDDDLDTPKALSLLFRTLHHPDIAPGDKLDLVTEMDGVLALDLVATAKRSSSDAGTFTPAVMRLVEERNLAQAARDLARMDAIRLELNLLGFQVEDHGQATRILARAARVTNPVTRGAG